MEFDLRESEAARLASEAARLDSEAARRASEAALRASEDAVAELSNNVLELNLARRDAENEAAQLSAAAACDAAQHLGEVAEWKAELEDARREVENTKKLQVAGLIFICSLATTLHAIYVAVVLTVRRNMLAKDKGVVETLGTFAVGNQHGEIAAPVPALALHLDS